MVLTMLHRIGGATGINVHTMDQLAESCLTYTDGSNLPAPVCLSGKLDGKRIVERKLRN